MSSVGAASATRKLKRHGLNVKRSDPSDTWGSQQGLFDYEDDGMDKSSVEGSSVEGSSVGESFRAGSGLSQGAHTSKMLLEKERMEGPNTITKKLMEIPGVVIFPVWLALYFGVCAITKKLARRASCKGKESSEYSSEDLITAKPLYQLATACFLVVILMQFSFMVFQISTKKRLLGSLVMFINLVSCTTYMAHAFDWIYPIRDTRGKDVQIARYLEWMSTTVMMLLTISAVGNSMSTKLVRSWKDTLVILFYDEVMLICGLLHSLTNHTSYGWIFEALACLCLYKVFMGVHKIVNESVNNAATTYEIYSMRALEILTYVFWILIALPHILYTRGLLTWLQFEVAATVMDVLTKTVYAVTLLTGNFCILDVVQTLRVAQLKAENKMKSSSVVRVDVMNQALHTAALEAEAEARLSRRFLANISHELRTPLNSVIAFNTLVIEDDTACSVPTHVEYCSSALTAAESLLGIINQVLDYTQLENEVQLSSRLALAHEPYSILDVMDELVDIISSRVNIRKVDFTVEYDPILIDAGAKHVYVGDSFRLRQCLANLCDNAIKFSKHVGGEVLVKVFLTPKAVVDSQVSYEGSEEAAEGKEAKKMVNLVLEIEDNGIGIDPDKHFLLFKPFSQVQSQMSRTAHGGTGLGLAITKSIVESMKGQVKCMSEGTGKGSTFRMEIPVELGTDDVVAKFSTIPLLPDAATTQVRLCLTQAPSKTMLLKMLFTWGVTEANVTDLCYPDIIPSGPELGKIVAQMKTDSTSATGSKIVYLIDSTIIVAMLNESATVDAAKADEYAGLLGKLNGIVAGHLDEQALLRKGLGSIGDQTLTRWQTVTRPWKYSALHVKLAQAIRNCSADPKDVTTAKWKSAASMRCCSHHSHDAKTPKASGGKPAHGGIKTRILLVDDHVVNQKVALRMVQKILGADNVDVHVANDGNEAINMVTKHTPDAGPYHVILMDVQMPNCDGLEATTKIREWEESSKAVNLHFICALTAHANKSDVEACIKSGMDKYMSKPLNLEDFRELLLTEIANHAAGWT